MNYYELICFSILLLYIATVISFTIGFFNLSTFFPSKNNPSNNNLKLSVLIPFKNEELNLPTIFQNLKNQNLNLDLFEVIFINDHSEDNSEIVLRNLINKESNFKLISSKSKKSGKKEALKEGVKNAVNNLIVTTDADCIQPETWLQTIYDFYLKHKPKMIIAPVIMKGTGFFGKLQALEFLSLSASTAGAAGLNKAIMCNGANLAFNKSIFNEFEDAMNTNEISGDDVFLLHSVKKKYPKSIYYLKSNDARVCTNTEPTLKLFFRQRIRWASKSTHYRDFDTILVSLIIFITNLLLAISLISLIFVPEIISLIFGLFGVKITADFILLSNAAYYFRQKKLLLFIPILSIIYPFYILTVSITGFFIKNIKWK